MIKFSELMNIYKIYRCKKEEHELRRNCLRFQRNQPKVNVVLSKRKKGRVFKQKKLNVPTYEIVSLYEAFDELENGVWWKKHTENKFTEKYRAWDEMELGVLTSCLFDSNMEFIKEDAEAELFAMFPVALAKKRIEVYKLPIEFSHAAWIIYMCSADRAGYYVLSLAYIMYKAAKHKVKKITAKFLADNVYTDGFFTNEYMSAVWGYFKVSQKLVSPRGVVATHSEKNSLDYASSWQSAINKLK